MTITPIPPFRHQLKPLLKKYASLAGELRELNGQLLITPTLGKSIGRGCYKIRLAIASKGTGKSGGARVIIYVRVVGETVFLLAIYDKSEQASISDQQVRELVAALVE
ncbi:hypothetical protein A0257_00180 [Hymenobacter psoromatis]|nr:hypothetical protein A0257_00180 [Hymenobacter psoromatis]